MRLSRVLPVMLFILGGCQGNQIHQQSTVPAPSIMVTNLTAQQIVLVKSGVAAGLKDPYSVVFGPMLAVERTKNGMHEIVVCGMINAKNSFGGYIGYHPFIGTIADGSNSFQVIAFGSGSTNAPLLVGGACRTAGMPILDMKI